MPIFEYACRKCGRRFEQLVYGRAVPECPACQGRKVEKQLSVFAAAVKGGGAPRRRPAPAPCGPCGDPRGPGSCSTN
jgi:putative FmdB family regulatory protein